MNNVRVSESVRIDSKKLVPSGGNNSVPPTVLVGEASDFGWAPGRWPVFVSTWDTENHTRVFGPGEAIRHHGEFGGYRYAQVDGAVEIHILND